MVVGCGGCIGDGGCAPFAPKGSPVVVGAPVQLNSCLLTADQPAQTLLPCNRIRNKINQSGKDGNILKGFEGPQVRAIFKIEQLHLKIVILGTVEHPPR